MKLVPQAVTALFRRKAVPAALSAVPSTQGFFGLIRESFTGAWQQNVTIDPPKTLLAFSAVYACVTIISSDIAKMRLMLIKQAEEGFWTEVVTGNEAAAFKPVLRKPNTYQNRIQFMQAWITSKLLHGNAYILKQRDGRGVVTEMYVLDPTLVKVLVAQSGDVYYELRVDNLSGITQTVTVPATEIIHDRMNPLWHPLVGVSPISACASAATMGNKITAHSNKFFENMARPSGVLSAAGTIQDATAERLKKYWEENFSANNLGRLAVLGDGLKYEAMTIPANDAQLIEQLKFTVEDVARAFHMPLHKLAAGPTPTYNNVEALNQQYYSDCLQILIESVEVCLDEGLALPERYGTELDINALLRMDTASRYDAHTKAIGGGWLSPNEARKKENLGPVEGGDTPYMQQQNYSLAALAKRDSDDPFAAPPPPPPADPADDPAAGEADDEVDAGDGDGADAGAQAASEEVAALMAYIVRGLKTASAEMTTGRGE